MEVLKLQNEGGDGGSESGCCTKTIAAAWYRRPRLEGIGPLRLLICRAKYVNDSMFPNVVGMLPVSLLLPKLKTAVS
jgi:hypothetical protein